MFTKPNIPETTASFGGVVIDFGDNLSDQEILPDRINKLQAIPTFITGNRCGHDPNVLRSYIRPEDHKPRPYFIEKGIELLKLLFDSPKKFFKKLITAHLDGRQVRSERREGVIAVAQVILHFLELETLRVGFFTESDEFVRLDLEYIAEKAGLSVIRTKRALSDLADAGYIKVTRQFDKKEDGTFSGKPSIREVTVQFFIDLGMDIQKLFFLREWKRKQREKKNAKKANKKVKGLLNAVTSFGKRKIFKPHSKRQLSLSVDIKKQLIGTALKMHETNPERTVSDYYMELCKLKE